jgi:2-C-methyl-D-erythritol 2,4-cyclodiphosphate synthase
MHRVGIGFDLHRLVKNRPLILGGITIPYKKGLLGHSDADAVCHAIMDALLGAMALGNIGTHFSDKDPKYKGISSIKLLEHVQKLVIKNKYKISNIDSTIICQEPKLNPYIPKMCEKIAKTLKIKAGQVSIKATTTEKLGDIGKGRAIAVQAICLIN